MPALRLGNDHPREDPGTGPDPRLELTEALLNAREATQAWSETRRWLVRHGAIDEAEEPLVLVYDADESRLVLLPDNTAAPVHEDSIFVGQQQDPLLFSVLSPPEPTLVESLRPLGWTNPAYLIPLAATASPGDPSAGTLILHGDAPPEPLLLWAARLLGTRLLNLRYPMVREKRKAVVRKQLLLRSILDAVTDPILLTDADGRLLVANEPAKRLFQAEPDASEGLRHAVSFNNMLFSARLGPGRFDTQETAERAELPLVDPHDGQDLLYELISVAIDDPDGGTSVVSILRNVEDLRQAVAEIADHNRRLEAAESRARAERDRLDLIIHAVAEPVIVSAPDGTIELMNPPAKRFFHEVSRDRAVLQRLSANEATFLAFVSNLYTARTLRWRDEITLVDLRRGQHVPFVATAGRVDPEFSEEQATVTILHDHSHERERAKLYEQIQRHSTELEAKVQEASEFSRRYEQLQAQASALESAAQAKDLFLANISHELRTPLQAVIGYTRLILRGAAGELSEGQSEKLEMVDSNARHLLGVINDLLDISKIEAGQVMLMVERFELRPLVEEVMKELDSITRRSEVRIRTRVTRELGIESDRKRIKQILLNLLSNALKFTPEGSIEVSAQEDPAGDLVAISVADTGIGIAEEDHERIFTDFYQVDRQAKGSLTRTYGGTGLGLPICRRIAEALRGELSLESSLGAGATFSLTLPRSFPDA